MSLNRFIYNYMVNDDSDEVMIGLGSWGYSLLTFNVFKQYSGYTSYYENYLFILVKI